MSNNTKPPPLSSRLYLHDRFCDKTLGTPELSSLIESVRVHDDDYEHIDQVGITTPTLAEISFETSNGMVGGSPCSLWSPFVTSPSQKQRVPQGSSLRSSDNDDCMKINTFLPVKLDVPSCFMAPVIPDILTPPRTNNRSRPVRSSSPSNRIPTQMQELCQTPPEVYCKTSTRSGTSPQVVYFDHNLQHFSEDTRRKLCLSIDSEEEEDELLVHMPPSLAIRPLPRSTPYWFD